jgi:hypothetical protein
MPLRYLLDENLRGGGLWNAIQQHNAFGLYPVDAVRVGDPPDLPCGTPDADLPLWAERERRVLVTRDWHTMPGQLTQHLQAGNHLAGVFLIRKHCTIPQVLAHLVLAAYAADPAACKDRIEPIP